VAAWRRPTPCFSLGQFVPREPDTRRDFFGNLDRPAGGVNDELFPAPLDRYDGLDIDNKRLTDRAGVAFELHHSQPLSLEPQHTAHRRLRRRLRASRRRRRASWRVPPLPVAMLGG
jgi:hypothetical protein